MLELHIANKNYSSWSLRPWILLKELGIPFSEKLTPFASKTDKNVPPRLSPSGKVPYLIDQGEVIWDSLAIIEYLAEQYPTVWPTDAKTRAWARCAAAEMHSGFSVLREKCTMNCGIRVDIGNISAPLQADINRLNALWNTGLDRFGGPFLAGTAFTAVDAFFAPVVFRIQTYSLKLNGAANAYVENMLARPFMREWYQDALAEQWREPGHEDDARACGVWVQDLRK